MIDKRQKLPNILETQPATESQIKFAKSMGIKLPKDVTKSDAAALIARDLDEDVAATEDLKAYAADKKILCSPYVGNKYLHTLIFDHLKVEDKIAFFCFCVYHFNFSSPDEGENLLEHPKRAWFEEFVEKEKNNTYFIDSMEEYIGEEIIIFGKVIKTTTNGKIEELYGGSIYTIAYKEAYNYLSEKVKNII